jgi:hypothetical protein
MLTKPENNATAESVEKELADLEAAYRAVRKTAAATYDKHRRKLRALLAVLKAEAER